MDEGASCVFKGVFEVRSPPPTPTPFSYWGPAASQNSPWCLSFSLLSESVSSPVHFFHLCVVSRIHLFLTSYGHALVWTRIAYPRTPLPRPLGLGLQCCTYNVCSTLSPHDPRKAYSSSSSGAGGSTVLAVSLWVGQWGRSLFAAICTHILAFFSSIILMLFPHL